MSSYAYRASTAEGRVLEGVMDASDEASVVANLRRQGYVPLLVETSAEAAVKRKRSFELGLPEFLVARVPSKDLTLFTRELATLLRAGLPLDRSLQSLGQLTPNANLKSITGAVLARVREGTALSEALAEHDRVFSVLYTSMVKAGEAGGVIETVLERLADYLERSDRSRDELRSAMTYPLVLAFVGGVSIMVLLTYVLPKFTVVFNDMGVAMPLSTRMVMAASEAVQSYWWVFLLAAVGSAVMFLRYQATPAGRMRIDRGKLALPLGGDLLRNVQVGRFARTLGTMLKSGVPLLQALDIVRATLTNRILSEALGSVERDVREGKGLAQPLERTTVFPPLALQMVAVGEETGRLDDMLLVVAEHCDRDVNNTVTRLMAMLEPAMLLVMGLVTGFIVIAMMSAVFSVNQMAF
ncbi:MAG: type II secretion system F family protein [Deltaproteobacteria bacterium]